MAHLMKEMIWRAKTPVYLIANGCTQAEIGHAWSIYFTPEYHIHLGPLHEHDARVLLENSIRRFGLLGLDSETFRDDVLRLSRHLPGTIVKMCELAGDPHYQCGRQIKTKLIHVDYLLKSSARFLRSAVGLDG